MLVAKVSSLPQNKSIRFVVPFRWFFKGLVIQYSNREITALVVVTAVSRNFQTEACKFPKVFLDF